MGTYTEPTHRLKWAQVGIPSATQKYRRLTGLWGHKHGGSQPACQFTHGHSLVFIHMSIEPATSIHLAPLHRYKGAQPTHDIDTHMYLPPVGTNTPARGSDEEEGARLAQRLVHVVWQQRESPGSRKALSLRILSLPLSVEDRSQPGRRQSQRLPGPSPQPGPCPAHPQARSCQGFPRVAWPPPGSGV